MAVIGNAKNAKVVIQPLNQETSNLKLTIRGNKYSFQHDENAGYLVQTSIFRQPDTALAQKLNVWDGAGVPLTMEAVEGRLRIWNGVGAWDATPTSKRIEVIDNTHLVGGSWDLIYGTLVSFENLDAPIAVTGVTVVPTSATLTVGNTQQLTATVAPANATNKAVSWSSSNTNVATVNSTGLVTAVAAGNATITVTTADGSKTATSAIVVNAIIIPKLYLGEQAVNKVYLGSTPVDRLYLGTTEVYSKNI